MEKLLIVAGNYFIIKTNEAGGEKVFVLVDHLSKI